MSAAGARAALERMLADFGEPGEFMVTVEAVPEEPQPGGQVRAGETYLIITWPDPAAPADTAPQPRVHVGDKWQRSTDKDPLVVIEVGDRGVTLECAICGGTTFARWDVFAEFWKPAATTFRRVVRPNWPGPPAKKPPAPSTFWKRDSDGCAYRVLGMERDQIVLTSQALGGYTYTALATWPEGWQPLGVAGAEVKVTLPTVGTCWTRDGGKTIWVVAAESDFDFSVLNGGPGCDDAVRRRTWPGDWVPALPSDEDPR